jgi:hypothetical protein
MDDQNEERIYWCLCYEGVRVVRWHVKAGTAAQPVGLLSPKRVAG